MIQIEVLDDLLAGRALPLLYALYNAGPDTDGLAFVAVLCGAGLALALAWWLTPSGSSWQVTAQNPSELMQALDAALCIGLNTTLLFHKAHKLDRNVGVSLSSIPLFVYLILLADHDCKFALRCIKTLCSLLIVLPYTALLASQENEHPIPPLQTPAPTHWTYLFLVLNSAYACAPVLCLQTITYRGFFFAIFTAACSTTTLSFLVDHVGQGGLFIIQMGWVVMVSSFIHIKPLRTTLGQPRTLMLAVSVILAAAFESPVRFHAEAVHQPASWAVAVLMSAGAVDLARANL